MKEITFEQWLAKDEGVVKFGMKLQESLVDGARAGWSAGAIAMYNELNKSGFIINTYFARVETEHIVTTPTHF